MKCIAVVGAGPSGLIAADVLSRAGFRVRIFDQMPSAGRRLLMAGRGGLNLTHGEEIELLLRKFGSSRQRLEPAIRSFPPSAVRSLALELGQETFEGTSGRVFPKSMKSSPMLRAWLRRLADQGVELTLRSQWLGGGPRDLDVTINETATSRLQFDAVVLALGGASWPRLGVDTSWPAKLAAWGIHCQPLVAANCGLQVAWTPHFSGRFSGHPLKRIACSVGEDVRRGEAMITRSGLEGGAIYAIVPEVRRLLRDGHSPVLRIDLRPDMPSGMLETKLLAPRNKQSTSTWLRKAAGLAPHEISLLREAVAGMMPTDAKSLAALIKAVPLVVAGVSTLERAISTAGGVDWSEIDDDYMLRRRAGVFVAGEMLDWEAPTGGYLLQACLSTGRAAAYGVMKYLDKS